MSMFSKIPWNIIGGFVPAIAEIVKQTKEYTHSGEDSGIEELKRRIVGLEAEKVNIASSFKFVLLGGIIISLISVAGLVLGIIALAR